VKVVGISNRSEGGGPGSPALPEMELGIRNLGRARQPWRAEDQRWADLNSGRARQPWRAEDRRWADLNSGRARQPWRAAGNGGNGGPGSPALPNAGETAGLAVPPYRSPWRVEIGLKNLHILDVFLKKRS
jgi:hypothetical protein